jgi:hypothetical protein
MSYSRRQLYAMGEPLGDSATRRKADGGLILGGGGGSSAPAQTTVSSTELPAWAKPYAERLMGKAEAATNQGYQTYDQNRIAGFSDLQTQAQNQAAGMQTSGQLDTASQMAQQAGLFGNNAAYQGGNYGNQYQAPGQYQSGQFGYNQVQGPGLQNYQMQGPQNVSAQQLQNYQMQGPQNVNAQQLQNYQMGPAQQVQTQNYTGNNVDQYMSPYMQDVVNTQQKEAQRQSDILGTQQAGQAVQQGAFGGSRAGLLEAERQRNLGTQLGNIQATGSQAAFQNAQQQFNQQQQANLQAQQANQQAGLTVGGQNLSALLNTQALGAGQNMQAQLANQQMGYNTNLQNLNAALGTQQFGAGQNMQAQLANQQMGYNTGSQNLNAMLGVQQLGAGQNMQAQLANQSANQAAQNAAEQSRQYGYGQSMNAAQNAAQYGLSAQQLGEQSRQFGANYGMQGAGLGLSAANALGNLGQTQYGQQMGINQLQNQYGAQQQALQQQGLSQSYQDFLNQQNFPYKQMGFMSDMIRGLPLGQQSTSSMYQGQGNIAGQVAGLGMGAYGMSRAFGYAEGGSVESQGNIENIVHTLSDQQLAEAKKAAQARGDSEQLQAIMAEESMRASERNGMGGAFNSLPNDQQQAMMAAGGMVAFADGDLVSDPMGTGGSEIMAQTKDTTPSDLTMMERLGIFNPENRRALEKGASEQRKAQAEKTRKPGEYSNEEKKLLAEAARKMEIAQAAEAKATPAVAKPAPASISAAVPRTPAAQPAPAEDPYAKFLADNKAMNEEYRAQQKADQEAMQARLAEQRKGAGADALAQFGFQMAAQAAKPGARFLGSAAAAAPSITDALAQSKKIENAMQDNMLAMNRENAKFNLSVSKGDMSNALAHAEALRKQKHDQEMLGLEYKKLGILAQQANQTATSPIQKIAAQLQASDPKLGVEDSLNRASEIAGYKFRTDAAQQGRQDVQKQKIEAEFGMMKFMDPSSPLYQKLQADKQKRMAELGGAQPAQSGGMAMPQGVTITKMGS